MSKRTAVSGAASPRPGRPGRARSRPSRDDGRVKQPSRAGSPERRRRVQRKARPTRGTGRRGVRRPHWRRIRPKLLELIDGLTVYSGQVLEPPATRPRRPPPAHAALPEGAPVDAPSITAPSDPHTPIDVEIGPVTLRLSVGRL